MTAEFVVLLAVLFGVVHLENARRGLFLRPLTLLQAGVAGWFLLRECAQGACGKPVGLALAFSTAAPFLGYFWWGRAGKIRRCALRTAFIASALALIYGVAVAGLLGNGWSLGFAAFIVVLVVTPWKPVRRNVQRRRQQRRRLALEKAATAEQEVREQEEAAERKADQAVLEALIEHLQR